MILKTRRWGEPGPDAFVCVHGVAQHGAVFEQLGQRLGATGGSVLAVDLRGHGASGRQPPWDTGTHVADLIETLDAEGVRRAIWVGHSFGGRLAAAAAAQHPDRTEALIMLDPGLEVDPERALRGAEIERLDWSFASPDGALNALLSNEAMVAPPRDVIAAFVREDMRKGVDGRFRFSFCPSAVVVAWSEIVLPAPPISPVSTLVVRASVSLVDSARLEQRYRDALGELLTWAPVPNGHNVLWEAPAETLAAIERFLAEEGLPGGA